MMLPSAMMPVLATAAAAPISKVLATGGTRTSAPRGEVTAVRTLTLDGFDEIAVAWSPLLAAHGLRMDLRAVFCHSRPQVSFPRVPSPFAPSSPHPNGRCELADLLIVIDYVDPATRQVDRRAVLVQAKMLKGGRLLPSGKEWIQHELLAWLPSFTFVDPGYDPRSRALAGSPLVGNPSFTAEYGGIDLKTRPALWEHWIPVPNTLRFQAHCPLADYLAGMATGDHSISREAIIGGTDDWSFTVDELLAVTGTKPIVKANAGVLRGNDNIVGFIADTAPHLNPVFGSADASGGDGGIPEGDGLEWPEGPISTVQLVFRSIDDFEDRDGSV